MKTMQKVKIFWGDFSFHVEKEVNEWLEQNPVTIQSISYDVVNCDGEMKHRILVLFVENNAKN